MEYKFESKRKFRYVRVYNIIRKPNESTNMLSKKVQEFVDKYFLKKNQG